MAARLGLQAGRAAFSSYWLLTTVYCLLFFGPRVVFLVDAADAFAGDVRVDLCGGEVAVAEHGLDAARVGAVFEQVRGEAVAQDVGRDALDAGLLGRALEHRPDDAPVD